MGREPTFRIAAVFCKVPYTDTYPHINMFRLSALKWLSLYQRLFLKEDTMSLNKVSLKIIFMGQTIPVSPVDPQRTQGNPGLCE
jgi:hypothetical protein